MTEPAYEGSDHMRGLPPDVQTTVGVIDGLRARIAELEARLSTLNEVETSLKKAEAENRALQLDLRDVLRKRDLCETRRQQAEAERDVLQAAFTQKNTEYVTVVGCISAWVNRLPRELGVAIHEGKKLVEPREGGEG